MYKRQVEVRIENTNVLFRTSQSGGFAPINSLQLSKQGVIKEFPDLKKNPNWREEAIKRFKLKIKSKTTEKKRMDYIIKDLHKFGYKPLYTQRAGHRPIKL